VLKFGAIWFINDKSVGTKLRWVIFPENFRSPYLWNYWSDTKSKGWSKNGTDMLYPHAKFGGDLPQHSGEIGKNWCFLFVCFCLFVTFTVYVSLGCRRAHCEGYIVAIYKSILMQFSTFLRRRNALSYFSKISELHHKMALHLSWN